MMAFGFVPALERPVQALDESIDSRGYRNPTESELRKPAGVIDSPKIALQETIVSVR